MYIKKILFFQDENAEIETRKQILESSNVLGSDRKIVVSEFNSLTPINRIIPGREKATLSYLRYTYALSIFYERVEINEKYFYMNKPEGILYLSNKLLENKNFNFKLQDAILFEYKDKIDAIGGLFAMKDGSFHFIGYSHLYFFYIVKKFIFEHDIVNFYLFESINNKFDISNLLRNFLDIAVCYTLKIVTFDYKIIRLNRDIYKKHYLVWKEQMVKQNLREFYNKQVKNAFFDLIFGIIYSCAGNQTKELEKYCMDVKDMVKKEYFEEKYLFLDPKYSTIFLIANFILENFILECKFDMGDAFDMFKTFLNNNVIIKNDDSIDDGDIKKILS